MAAVPRMMIARHIAVIAGMGVMRPVAVSWGMWAAIARMGVVRPIAVSRRMWITVAGRVGRPGAVSPWVGATAVGLGWRGTRFPGAGYLCQAGGCFGWRTATHRE